MTKVQEGSTAGLIHNFLLRCARILLQQLGIVVLPNASSLRLQAVVKLQSRWRRALSREATRRFLASRDELLGALSEAGAKVDATSPELLVHMRLPLSAH